MSAQVVEEAIDDGCCGERGTYGEGLLSIWDTADGSSLVQVLGTNVVVLQQRLVSGGTETTSGKGKVGTNGESLGREEADRRTAGRFYVAVVQAVLLFGSETWAITPWMDKALKGFHHRAVRQMSGMGSKRQWGGT